MHPENMIPHYVNKIKEFRLLIPAEKAMLMTLTHLGYDDSTVKTVGKLDVTDYPKLDTHTTHAGTVLAKSLHQFLLQQLLRL